MLTEYINIKTNHVYQIKINNIVYGYYGRYVSSVKVTNLTRTYVLLALFVDPDIPFSWGGGGGVH